MSTESTLGVDLGDTPQKLRELVDRLAEAERALGNFKTSTETFNTAGDIVSRVAKIATESGKTITVAFQRSGDSLKAVSGSITDTTNQLIKAQNTIKTIGDSLARIDAKNLFPNLSDRELKSAQSTLTKLGTGLNFSTSGASADAQKVIDFEKQKLQAINSTRQAAKEGEATLKGLFPAPTDATLAQIKSYDNAIKSIVKDMKDGKLTADQLSQALSGVASGKVSAQIENLKKISTGNRTDAASLRQTVENTFPAPSGATSNQLIAYNNGLVRIESTLQKSTITAERFNEVLRAVAQGKQLPNLTIDERQITSGLNRVKNAFTDIKNTSDSATLSFANFARIGAALAFKRELSELASQVRESVAEVLKLQIAIAEIRTVSQSANVSSAQWAETLTRVSNSFGIPQAQVAEAAYQALSSQLVKGARDTEQFLNIAAEFSRVTRATLPEGLNLLSTTLNSYGQSVGSAEKVSGQFFEIIAQGKLRVEDIAKSFGRVSPIAAELGIKLSDIGAIIVSLTKKGVQPDTAVTQTLNLLNQLQSPSKELKDLIQSLGYESVQTAISGGKFLEFLDQLSKKADGSSAELAKLLKNIRGRAAFVGSFSDELAPLSKQIEQSGQQFDVAKVIRAQPAADELIKEFTKVKNFLINEVGTKIVETFASISKSIGGIAKPITFVIDAAIIGIKGLATGFGVYLVTSAAAAARNVALSLSARQAAVSYNELGIAIAKTNIEAGKTSGLGAGRFFSYGVIAYSLYEIYDSLVARQTKFNISLKESEAQVTKLIQDYDTARARQVNRESAEQGASVDEVVGKISGGLASQLANVNSQIDSIRENARASAEQLTASLADFGKAFNDSLQDSKKAIEQARTSIRAIGNDVSGFKSKISQALLNVTEKFANPQQQVQLITNQINKLVEENQGLQKKGDQVSLEQFKKNSEELINLYVKRYEKIQEIEKRFVEASPVTQQEIDAAKRRVQQGRTPDEIANGIKAPNGKQLNIARDFISDLSPLQKDLASLEQSYNKGLDAFQKALKDRSDAVAKEVRRQEDVFKQLQQKVQDISKFNPLTQSGELKSQFVNPKTGSLDPKKLQDEINKLTDTSKFGEFKADPNALRLFKDIEDRKTQIFKEAELERRSFRLRQQQNELSEVERQLKNSKGPEQQQQLESGFDAEVKQKVTTLKQLVDVLKSDALSGGSGLLVKIFGDPAAVRAKIAEIQQQLKDVQEASTKAIQGGLGNSGNVVDFQKKFQDLADALSKIKNFQNFQGAGGVPLSDIIKQLQNSTFVGPVAQFQELQKQIDETKRRYDALKAAADPIGATIGDPAKNAVDPLQRVKDKLEEIYNEMKKIKDLGPIKPIGGNGSTSLNNNGGGTGFPTSLDDNSSPLSNTFGANEGGFVGGMPGRDVNLISANRREYIMNEEATRQFRPILDVMNSSKIYNNSLQFGDINVRGNSSAEQAQDLVSQIKRFVRTGQLRL